MSHKIVARGTRGQHGQRRDRGQALVEFAVVFPVIVLILFAVFDFGRAVYAYNTIANAAREGARVAAVNQVVTTNTSCTENMPVESTTNPHWSVKACAAASAVSLGVQTSAVTVSYAAPANTDIVCSPTIDVGCIASVTVTYTWHPMTPVISALFNQITLTSTSQVPVERVFP